MSSYWCLEDAAGVCFQIPFAGGQSRSPWIICNSESVCTGIAHRHSKDSHHMVEASSKMYSLQCDTGGISFKKWPFTIIKFHVLLGKDGMYHLRAPKLRIAHSPAIFHR